MSKSICVVGVACADVVVRVPRLATPGETVVADEVSEAPGGRGLSQAIAASRLGAKVSFVGCIGDDARGSDLRGALATEGVELHHARTLERTPSAVCVHQLLPDGRVASTLVPGASVRLSAADLDEAAKEIRAADVLLLQGELPPEVNRRAIEIAGGGPRVVLHAAPASGVVPELLRDVALLVAGREEAVLLLGDTAGDVAPAGLARRLGCLGPERVVLDLGAEGALHFHGTELSSQEAAELESHGPLGRADAFVAALAVQLAEGARMKDALRLASTAAALAGGTSGGPASLPTRERVESALRR